MKRLFHLLFMPCEGISAHVSQSCDRELSAAERFAVGLHLLYCRACRRYRNQIRHIRKILGLADQVLSDAKDLQLNAEARECIIKAISSS